MKADPTKYNGYTLQEIEKNLNPSMIDIHKQDYLNNCKAVINRQTTGYNLNEIEGLKNYNFNLIKIYLS